MLFFFLILIISAIFHEYAHGWMAYRLGDSTAKYAGRLTLDPRAHVDPFGTFLMPLALYFLSGGAFLFAYAKPVPFNPYNLKDARFGPLWVAIAGPISNITLAAIFGILVAVFPSMGVLTVLFALIVRVNILLAVFNMVPIPPLDGSKVLFALLPDSMNNVKILLEKYGYVFLLVFVLFFFSLINPIIDQLFTWFTFGVRFGA